MNLCVSMTTYVKSVCIYVSVHEVCVCMCTCVCVPWMFGDMSTSVSVGSQTTWTWSFFCQMVHVPKLTLQANIWWALGLGGSGGALGLVGPWQPRANLSHLSRRDVLSDVHFLAAKE